MVLSRIQRRYIRAIGSTIRRAWQAMHPDPQAWCGARYGVLAIYLAMVAVASIGS